jgi:hypothetical protein
MSSETHGSESKNVRTFKVKLASDENSTFRGRFVGNNPQQAAKKALTSILSEQKKKTGTYELILRETTRGSNKKEYSYIGNKIKRKEPNKVFFNGSANPILYKYDTFIKSKRLIGGEPVEPVVENVEPVDVVPEPELKKATKSKSKKPKTKSVKKSNSKSGKKKTSK